MKTHFLQLETRLFEAPDCRSIGVVQLRQSLEVLLDARDLRQDRFFALVEDIETVLGILEPFLGRHQKGSFLLELDVEARSEGQAGDVVDLELQVVDSLQPLLLARPSSGQARSDALKLGVQRLDFGHG